MSEARTTSAGAGAVSRPPGDASAASRRRREFEGEPKLTVKDSTWKARLRERIRGLTWRSIAEEVHL